MKKTNPTAIMPDTCTEVRAAIGMSDRQFEVWSATQRARMRAILQVRRILRDPEGYVEAMEAFAGYRVWAAQEAQKKAMEQAIAD